MHGANPTNCRLLNAVIVIQGLSERMNGHVPRLRMHKPAHTAVEEVENASISDGTVTPKATQSCHQRRLCGCNAGVYLGQSFDLVLLVALMRPVELGMILIRAMSVG